MVLSLFIIFVLGILGGFVFEKIKLPKLIWYIVLGILISPSVLNIVDDTILDISSYLRQIALVIILTRSGLSLDVKTLRKIGSPAILMAFLPALFEIIGITIFGPILLGISILEALLLGSVLAAVSPAIVVPRMIKLMDEGYGGKHHTPELVMAGASCDDIFVIVLFYCFKTMCASNTININMLIQIPTSIILGVILGFIIGFSLVFVFRKTKFDLPFKTLLTLGLCLGMIALENVLKQYLSISSLLGIFVVGIVICFFKRNEAVELGKSYKSLWSGFEILLFVLVGCQIDVNYAFSMEGLTILGLIAIALLFRSFGCFLCIIRTDYSMKEKLFIIMSYLPKATVQASIGGIALQEGLNCGVLIITGAVISILFTAPLGAILMDNTYENLLEKNEVNDLGMEADIDG